MSDWHASDLVRLTAGVLDLTAPTTVAAVELGRPPHPGDVLVYRVLGARQVLQAWLTARTGWGALGAAVDAAHLASMLPVAVLPQGVAGVVVLRVRRPAVPVLVVPVLVVPGVGRPAHHRQHRPAAGPDEHEEERRREREGHEVQPGGGVPGDARV